MSASLVAELRANITEFSAKMGEARAEVAKLGTQSAGHMEKLQTVGKAAFLGLGVAAVAGAVIAVKAAGDYQESLTQLVTGAGESEKNIKLVGDGMLHMAGQVGIGAQGLSKGMFLIESAGYHGADGLTVLKGAAEGARVGAADMATVADGLTTALNDYHLPASAAADVTSKLVETVSLGKTHMQDLAGSLATVLPAASAAHLGLSQVLGAMATMTAKGTPAADAATYLKQTIINLEKPSAKASSEMKALGLSSIDISTHLGQRGLTGTFDLLTNAIQNKMGPAGIVLIDSLKKSAGNTTAFQKVLANLPPTQQSYIEALGNMVGGAKSMQAALQLTGDGAKTFGEDVKAISGTTTEAGGHVKGWELTQKDLNTQLANMKTAAESVAIEVGQKLIPVLTEALVWIQKHKGAAEVLAAAIGTVLVGAIAAYIAHLAVAGVKSVIEFGKMTAAGFRWVNDHGAQLAEWIAKQVAAIAKSVALWVAHAAVFLAQAVADGAKWLAANAVKLAVYLAAHVATAIAVAATWVAANAAMLVASGGIILALALIAVGAYELYKHWDQVWGFIKRITEDAFHFLERMAGDVVKFLILVFKGWFDSVMIGYETIVHGAAKAFGWIPGLGGKLKEAARGFDEFQQAVDGKLQQVADSAGRWGQAAGANVAAGMTQAFNANFGGFQAAGLSAVAAASAAGAQAKLSQYADGGVIGGRRGEAQVVIAHGGEVVLNENQQEGFRNVMGAYGAAASQPTPAAPSAGSQQPIVVQLMLDGQIIAENTLTVLQRRSQRGHVLGLP